MIYWFIHRLLIHYTQWTTSATAAHAAAADDTHDAAVPCEEIISRYVMPCFFAVRKFLYPSAEMSRTGGWLGGRLGGRLGEWLGGRLGRWLGDRLGDRLGGRLGGRLGERLGERLGGRLGGRLGERLGGRLGGWLGEWLGGRLGGRLGEWLARRFGERGEWFALSDVLVLEPPVKDGTLLLELPVKEQPELRAHR